MKRFLKYDVSHIAEIRKDIILKGKHSDKFKKILKRYAGKANSVKYGALNEVEGSGSINQLDAELLYSITKYYKPVNIFEVGTWFGTSAYVMAMAAEGYVYTCDKQNIFTAKHPGIKYYHDTSNRVLKIIKKKKIKIDMVFADGRLSDDDIKMISKMCKVFVVHDYEGKKKGWRAARDMKKLWKKAELIKPLKDSSVAVLVK